VNRPTPDTLRHAAGMHAGWVALGIIAVIVVVALRAAHHQHGLHRLTWRWLTGAPLDGRTRYTNRGWWTPGDRVMHVTGRAARRHHVRRAYQAAGQTGVTVLALAVTVGLVTDRSATIRGGLALAVAACVLGPWPAWRATRGWRHRALHVRPLHHALGAALGVPVAKRPDSWLIVPQGYGSTEGARITVALPKTFAPAGDARAAVESIVSAKLGLSEPGVQWDLAGKRPQVVFTVHVPPPSAVRFADIAAAMAAAAITAPVLGIGRGAKMITADLDGDSPHIALSMGSGAGKSVTSRTLIAQTLNKGGVALILDIKRLSHSWARNLPNVRYCRDIAEIHDALMWISGEIDRRNTVADEGADDDGNTDSVYVGPRMMILAEELNATSQRLAAYWRKIKQSDDPARSPAVDALADAFFMGRQIEVNIIAVAQMLTAQTAGGPAARENCGIRILGRFTMNAARMMVPEINPPPRSSVHRGRVQVCVGGVAEPTQIAFLSAKEAKRYAVAGIVTPFPAEGAGTVRVAEPAPAAAVEPIGLGRAVELGVVSIKLDSLRAARGRDPEFPESIATGLRGELLYSAAELARWERNRPKAGKAASA
jgi:hypothetical protein